ncbi:MAG: type I DNA topoisomerase [Alphaproteobacteria bacterium]|nr:type I DNA topoisomerase [Alphaproteobacteria bacterium]MCB9928013.1 type I DNA topoisomerase [Alphaproteobacteria bacterium]
MKVVVVESPAKAKTINKYLGSEYKVLASYGHVRDLPPKDGSVRPDEDFAMDWDVDPDGDKRIKEIARALKSADSLILATDPDREGEAISWHVKEELARRRALGSRHVERVVFHEITKSAVLDAIDNPRDLNQEMVEAYLARRALDYLVGFTLSPILWRKLPGSRSAGRVQSVALRLVCERENEIERFVPQEYWSIEAACLTAAGKPFTARVSQWQGKRLDRLGITTKAMADEIVAAVQGASLSIAKVEKRQVRRNPPPPFTTSTLQQEASRKLRFSASQTMRIAQRLYEGVEIGGETAGLITYMRTDSVNLSNEALGQARDLIRGRYPAPYLPDAPRRFQNKTKNAQEAHEAIRPTDMARDPSSLRGVLEPQQLALYELVWKRTLASQMANAVLDQVTVDIETADRQAGLRAVGTTIRFDGFLTLYQEDVDDPTDDKDSEGRLLPPMAEGEAVKAETVTPEQHFTQPPPRFTEASLVKKLEELGIGRPSTYASILQVLQDRQYVTLDRRRFKAEDRGRLVTAFLENFFHRYVEYDFTADLEQSLDDVSNGDRDWRQLLREFWEAFFQRVEETKDLTIRQVIDVLDEELGRHFFPPNEDGTEPRACPACGDGRLGLRLSRTGAFIGCSNYPNCAYTRPLAVPGEDDGMALPKVLGVDPDSSLEVSLRKGPYGLYVQLGEASEENKKPKRASLLRGTPPDSVDLAMALALLSLPREVGLHPETGQPITAAIGRYGPYIAHDKKYVSLKGDDDVLSIGLNRAVTLLAESKSGGSGVLRELGEHPDDGKPVTLNRGRFGPYVKHGSVMASLRKANDPDTMTLEDALVLVAAKAERAGKGSKAKGKAAAKTEGADAKPAAKKKAPAKKATAKKASTKKPAAKKTTKTAAAAKPAARKKAPAKSAAPEDTIPEDKDA